MFPRSLLFVPGNNRHMIENACRSQADAVILDLEDAVPPNERPAARALLGDLRLRERFPDVVCVVRVNGARTRDHEEDLRAAAAINVRGVLVPKVERAEDLSAADELLVREKERQETGSRVMVMALVETPGGVLRIADLVEKAPASLAAVGFGAEDYSAALGLARGDGSGALEFARAFVAAGAALRGLPAIDAPELEVLDLDRLRREALRARSLGFRAKFAIHPAQLNVIQEVFSPTEEEEHWAQRVVQAYDASISAHAGAATIDGRMIDAATIRRARAILGSTPRNDDARPPE